MRLHVRLVAYLTDTDEAALVVGRKKGVSPFCHYLDADGELLPGYFFPAAPPGGAGAPAAGAGAGAAPVPVPPPVAGGAPAALPGGAAPAAPAPGQKPKLKSVKEPASTPCTRTSKALREYLGNDKESLKQANLSPFFDVGVSARHGACVSHAPASAIDTATGLLEGARMLLLCMTLAQNALDSAEFSNVTGSELCEGQGDYLHVVSGTTHCRTVNSVCPAIACPSWLYDLCCCVGDVLGAGQLHCGVGDRLKELVAVVFRMHELELQPGTPMLTLAARANDKMGELMFRLVCVGCI